MHLGTPAKSQLSGASYSASPKQPTGGCQIKERRFMRRIIMALMLATLVAFAVAGAAWVLVAPPAKAAFPGENGRIVFHRQDSNGLRQTWVADKDLSDQAQLTSGSAESGWAVWKPGGA